MFAYKSSSKRRKKEEAEKPFWISFADLMTALMALFLVIMSVSLLIIVIEITDADLVPKKELDYEKLTHENSVTNYFNEVLENERLKALLDKDALMRQERNEQMQTILVNLEKDAHKIKACNIHLEHRKDALSIVFSSKDPLRLAMFDSGSYQLKNTDKQCIREFIPSIYQHTADKKWFQRVAVEGFTDTDGAYLLNLNLSLQRAQSVVCSVLTPMQNSIKLEKPVLDFVQQKFTVGGFSFNSAKANKEESRRVELRLDFKSLDEYLTYLENPIEDSVSVENEIGLCAQQ